MTKFLNISTDNTLGGLNASDVVVSSQKAIRTAINQKVGADYDTSNKRAIFDGAIGSPGTPVHNSTISFTQGGVSKGSFTLNQSDNATIALDAEITNCITEIPQNIKIELNNGVLTIKSGTKVYIPNGLYGSSKVFTEYTLTTDKVCTITGSSTNGKHMIFLNSTGSNDWIHVDYVVSGTTDSASSRAWHAWYDTTNNYVKLFGDYAGFLYNTGFPIAIATITSGVWTSLDQVFDVFGYVGSAIFSLPGVSFICPNGRNADGTSNNIIKTSTAVTVENGYNEGSTLRTVTQDYIYYTGVGTIGYWCVADSFIDYYPTPASNKWWRVYDTRLNKLFYSSAGAAYRQSVEPFYLGTVSRNNNSTPSKITDLVVEKTFQAQDHYDTGYMAHQAMPSSNYIDLTLGANGTTYTAPADGWFALKKIGNANEIISFDNGEFCTTNCSSTSGISLAVYIPVRKGEAIIAGYSASGSTTYFRFVYAEGSK